MASYPERVRESIAANIRAKRARDRIEQDQIAELMRELGFSYWRRQTVSQVERGKRRLSAEELLGLSRVLQTSITALTAP